MQVSQNVTMSSKSFIPKHGHGKRLLNIAKIADEIRSAHTHLREYQDLLKHKIFFRCHTHQRRREKKKKKKRERERDLSREVISDVRRTVHFFGNWRRISPLPRYFGVWCYGSKMLQHLQFHQHQPAARVFKQSE